MIEINPKVFYKFGVTSKYNVQDRFKDIENDYDVTVLFSHYLPENKAIQQEQNYLDRFKKGMWLDDKIKGVTETRYFDEETKKLVLRELYKKRSEWIKDKEKFKSYTCMKFYFVEIKVKVSKTEPIKTPLIQTSLDLPF